MRNILLIVILLLVVPINVRALTFTVANSDGVDIKYITVGQGTVEVSALDYTGSVRVPETVTYEGVTYTVVKVGSLAFSNKSGLRYVQLPATITDVGSTSFRNSDNLDSIRLLSVVPPKLGGNGLMLSNAQVEHLVIHVPDGCIRAYRENNWFASYNRVPLNITSDNHTTLTVMLPTGYDVHFAYNHSWQSQPTRMIDYSDYENLNIHRFLHYDAAFFYILTATTVTTDPNGQRVVVGDNQGYIHFDLDGMDTLILMLNPVVKDSLCIGYDNGAMGSRFVYALSSANDTLRPILIANLYGVLDVNNIATPYNIHSGLSYPWHTTAGYHVPAASAHSTIFASNLWLSGLTYDGGVSKPYVRAGTLTSDWQYGPADPTMTLQERRDYYRIWSLSRAEIDDFLANVGTPGYAIPDNIASWPVDSSSFYDADSNGVYEPAHGDYPIILGDKMLYAIFNDHGGAMTGSDHEIMVVEEHTYLDSSNYDTVNNYYPPIHEYDTTIVVDNPTMNMEIHAMLYAFDEPDDTALNNTVFLRYNIHNLSETTCYDVRFGAWTDLDIGYGFDDYVGCDVMRGMYYAFNGDDVDGPGENAYEGIPPAQSCTFLAGPRLDPDGSDNPADSSSASSVNGANFGNGIVDDERLGMTGFIYYENSANSINGEPSSSNDFYNYLEGLWKNGQHILYGGNGISSGTTDIPCHYMFPGDSDPLHWGTDGVVPDVNPDDWTDPNSGNYVTPGDRRGLASSGPFTFLSGQCQTLDLAYTTAFGADGAWSSVEKLRLYTDNVRRQFLRDTTDSGKPFTYRPYSAPVVVGIEEPALATTMKLYPNPASSMATVRFNTPGSRQLQLFDIRGTLLKCYNTTATTLHLDLSSLAKGIYILRCGEAVAKIVKQ